MCKSEVNSIVGFSTVELMTTGISSAGATAIGVEQDGQMESGEQPASCSFVVVDEVARFSSHVSYSQQGMNVAAMLIIRTRNVKNFIAAKVNELDARSVLVLL